MSDYIHPYKDTAFVLETLVDFDRHCAQIGANDLDQEFALAVLNEAAKFGSEVLAPLNPTGNNIGAKLTKNGVEITPGLSEAYKKYVSSGWPSLGATESYGGQALPNVLSGAVNEIWHSANMAFALAPMLTQGAIETIETFGSEELKQTYLPKLISGEWTGTMDLTESDAGSDLAAVKTKAIPNGDHYLIKGQKIFITWGDHQMTENIVHLVLARLPDAPSGIKGISLFVVPKYLQNSQGAPVQRNDVNCVSLEHKLGIHASPTCTINFGDQGGAIGYLVGEAHSGMKYMFTMMNNARLAVGMQGMAISERAYQPALAYAKSRLQSTNKDGSRDSIIQFPDVRRMLLHMKSAIEAMRALSLITMANVDCRDRLTDDLGRKKYSQRVELLTPIVKGWSTELAQEVTYLAIQIHGGMGYIEETGVAQHYRDARILTIYEGTTGIQALDLSIRKTLLNKGEHLADLLSEIEHDLVKLKDNESLSTMLEQMSNALSAGKTARQWLLDRSDSNTLDAKATSFHFLMLMGYLCGGWVMTNMAANAHEKVKLQKGDLEFLQSKIVTARFYCEQLLPRVESAITSIKAGSQTIMALSEDQF